MPDKGDFIFTSKLVLGSPTDSKQFKREGIQTHSGDEPGRDLYLFKFESIIISNTKQKITSIYY